MSEQISFEELIGDDQLTLVDFYADWCGPCQAMNPILEEVASALGEKVKIIKVDADAHPTLVEKYSISNLPALILFQKGEIKWRSIGMQSVYHLKKIINEFFEENFKQNKEVIWKK